MSALKQWLESVLMYLKASRGDAIIVLAALAFSAAMVVALYIEG